MRTLGQVFPILMILLGVVYTLSSFAQPETASHAIAAAVLFGSVFVGYRLKWR